MSRVKKKTYAVEGKTIRRKNWTNCPRKTTTGVRAPGDRRVERVAGRGGLMTTVRDVFRNVIIFRVPTPSERETSARETRRRVPPTCVRRWRRRRNYKTTGPAQKFITGARAAKPRASVKTTTSVSHLQARNIYYIFYY